VNESYTRLIEFNEKYDCINFFFGLFVLSDVVFGDSFQQKPDKNNSNLNKEPDKTDKDFGRNNRSIDGY
jgi:hypothetical protein